MPRMAWQDGEIDIGDVRIHYYRRGQGRPLVMAHGMSDNGRCWERLATVLEDRYDIVAYDARYHGLSNAPEGGGFAGGEDLIALVEALALEKPALLGHSMGAASVAHAAKLRPELFRCAILEDPPWRESWENLPSRESRNWQSQTVQDIIAGGKAQGVGWNDDEYPAWAESKRQFRPPADWAARRMAGISDWKDTVAAIDVPTLLIRGGNHERGAIVTDEVASEAQRLNPRMESVCFAQAGHNIRREAFAPYVAAVTAFLARRSN